MLYSGFKYIVMEYKLMCVSHIYVVLYIYTRLFVFTNIQI